MLLKDTIKCTGEAVVTLKKTQYFTYSKKGCTICLENKLACLCLFQYVTGLILFVYDLDAKIMIERILTDTKILITSQTIYLVYATV